MEFYLVNDGKVILGERSAQSYLMSTLVNYTINIFEEKASEGTFCLTEIKKGLNISQFIDALRNVSVDIDGKVLCMVKFEEKVQNFYSDLERLLLNLPIEIGTVYKEEEIYDQILSSFIDFYKDIPSLRHHGYAKVSDAVKEMNDKGKILKILGEIKLICDDDRLKILEEEINSCEVLGEDFLLKISDYIKDIEEKI